MSNARLSQHDQRSFWGRLFDRVFVSVFRLVMKNRDLNVQGLKNLEALRRQPGETGVLVNANHVSLRDAVQILCAMPQDQMLRLAVVMDVGQYQAFTNPRPMTSVATSGNPLTFPWMVLKSQILAPRLLRLFFNRMEVHRVDSDNVHSIRDLTEKVQNGQNALIFMEGRLTATGKPMHVFDGGAKILMDSRAPLMNLHLSGFEHLAGMTGQAGAFYHQAKKPKMGLSIAPLRTVPADLPTAGPDVKSQRRAVAHWVRDVMLEDRVRAANTDRTLIEALWDAGEEHGFDKKILGGPALTPPKGYAVDKAALAAALRARLQPGEKIGSLMLKPSFKVAVPEAVEMAGGACVVFPETDKLSVFIDKVVASGVRKVLVPEYILPFGDWAAKVDALKANGIDVLCLDLPREKRKGAAGEEYLDVLYHVRRDFPITTPDLGDLTYRDLLGRIHTLAPALQKALGPVQTAWRAAKVEAAVDLRGETPPDAVQLASLLGGHKPVGTLLPNAKAGVVALYALQALGRVPAILNPKAGLAAMLSCVETAGLEHVITSRMVVEVAQLQVEIQELQKRGIKIVYLEDLRKDVSLLRHVFPAMRHAAKGKRPKLPARDPKAPAVILFTSGTTGKPKGVAISHKGLLTNVEQLDAVMSFTPAERITSVLPFFHSFGNTIGLVFAPLKGLYSFLAPNPLKAREVNAATYFSGGTVLGGTATFVRSYLKRARHELQGVKYFFFGGERTPPDLFAKLHEAAPHAIGIEGYGTTETGPVIAANTPADSRLGTVGRALPLTEIRVVPRPGIDDTPAIVASGKQQGVLHVKAPQNMLGYILPEQPGYLQPLVGGEHDTGDIVSVDSEGFITIIGRNKHFAKIGGEMVPWQAVTDKLAAYDPQANYAVVSVPAAEKGDKLVLFTDRQDVTLPFVREAVVLQGGMTDIAVPKDIRVLEKGSFPVLGTGKPDVFALQQKAAEEPARPRGDEALATPSSTPHA
jgi:acyl-CoA synthetase (AMP-forming)/AMP-acid ligase II/1-acyl-sn-glycerol-3-phosphate acyltransferase